MLASRSASFNGQRAKLVGEIINLKSVPQKSPRRFVPKTSGPQWSEWSEWSECKGSCDQAVKNSRSRDRKCVSKGKTVQDSECYKKGNGQSIELEDCQRQCAEWTEWAVGQVVPSHVEVDTDTSNDTVYMGLLAKDHPIFVNI